MRSIWPPVGAQRGLEGVEAGALSLHLPVGLQIWMMLLGILLLWAPAVAANTWIGLQGGQPFIHFGYVDPAEPPVVVTGGTQLLVVSPGDTWSLTMEAQGDLVNSQQPEVKIPVSRLAWALHDGDPPHWTPLTPQMPSVLYNSADPTPPSGQAIQLDYRFSPSWEDPPLPGQYATDLCFTLSSNLDLLQSWVYPTPFRADGLDLLTIGYWLPGIGLQQLELIITDSDGAVVRRSRINQLGGEWRDIVWNGYTVFGDYATPGLYYYHIIKLPQGQPIAAGMIQVAHDDKPSGSSSIRGKISKADTGAGALGAQVALYTRERRQVATCSTQTNGAYQLAGLSEGEYYLEASLPGYIAAQTEVFYLDGYTDQEMDLGLLPNRALDLDLQLSARSVAVGDLLKATVRITNSGTRDLLDTVVTLSVPAGFAYGGGSAETGDLEMREGVQSSGEINWATGSLREGESRQAEIWFLVGLDAPVRNAQFTGQAHGYATLEKVVTPRVSQAVEVTAGPFVATSPQWVADCHLVLPVADGGFLEIRLQPDAAIAKPGLPFAGGEMARHLERSTLVPVADPFVLEVGKLAPHSLRVRLDGGSWALEGGQWRHALGQLELLGGVVSLAGVQTAASLGDGFTLRGFYGLPLAWPIYSLYPADNTSGPFTLPRAPTPWGRVDVRIVSWDPVEHIWQEEPPVLFRMDGALGTITLGRALGALNAQGHQQYVLVTYAGQEMGPDHGWMEVGWTIEKPNWSLFAGYVETGVKGQIKMATIGGRAAGEGFMLQGNLRTLLGEKPRFWPGSWDPSVPEVEQKDGTGSAAGQRAAWQITGALEPYLGLRLGGGWSMDGPSFGGFWGLTAPDAGLPKATGSQGLAVNEARGLDGLMLSLRGELAKQAPGQSHGVGPLLASRGKRRAQALGGELDLANGWMTSFVTSRSSSLLGRDTSFAHGEQDVTKGWEQRLIYQAPDLPHWSLGYGQRETQLTSSESKGKLHYGLLEVGGQVSAMEWSTRLSLSQSLSPRNSTEGNPVGATAQLNAKYGEGRFRPYVQGSQGGAFNGIGEDSGLRQEEWTMGVEGQVSDELRLSVAHTKQQGPETGVSTAPDHPNNTTVGSGQVREQLALGAYYGLGQGWTLQGSCQWPMDKQNGPLQPPWQAGLELRGKIGPSMVLDVGWGRSSRQRTDLSSVSVDQVAVGIRSEKLGQIVPHREIRLSTSFQEGRSIAWELWGEGSWLLGKSWEIWTHAAHKQVTHDQIGQVITEQGVVRLSRRLGQGLAGFTQVGGWRQVRKAEIGCSLGISYQITPEISLAVGHTWPLDQRESEVGFLSVQPGFFVQLFAR